MKPISLFIDTDMGVDDVMTIAMLLKSSRYTIKGISTVFGVATAKNGANNLSRILEYFEESIPLYQGMEIPAKSDWNATFPSQDRLRSNQLTLLKNLPLPTKSSLKPASLSELFLSISREEENITLVCLGPLTNIAYLINQYGEKFTERVSQIVMMGGAVYKPGNVPPREMAEYNIYLDPEAAQTVFTSSIPITLVPIDATMWVPARSKAFISKVKKTITKNRRAEIIKAIILNNKGDFNSFYDPLVAAIMINPSIVTRKKMTGINIILEFPNRGQTGSDETIPKKITVITKVTATKFYQVIINQLTMLK